MEGEKSIRQKKPIEEREITIKQALDLAVKSHTSGELHKAELIYQEVLNKEPNNPDALHLLGLIKHQKGRHEDAVEYISKAIQLKPNTTIYYGNLGMVYDALGKEQESAENYKKALEIDSQYETAYLAYYNLGVFHNNNGKITEALEHFDKSLELKKDFAEAHWNRSLILLLLGRFKEGWKEYEYRFKKEKPPDSRNFQKPKWDGSSLQGRKILVVSEQGSGDNIQFIRYIPLIKEKGGYVILECKKELRRLFENFPGVDEFVDKENDIVPNIDFDFYIHLMSLPGLFNTDLHNIPDKIPYLKADNNLAEKFKSKLNTDNFKIGIAWAGNPNQDNDRNRSTTFDKFQLLKGIPKTTLISLQKGEASRQLNQKLNDFEIINMAEDITDFADTAAIIENLDLIISVDTSVAHLAGAMGKPVWTLLTFMPAWRWLLYREDTPWYPGMKLFRQEKKGDWDSLFNKVGKELKNLVMSRTIKSC